MEIHRIVWEANFGKIPKGFHIHHIDWNHSNNKIDNLQCLSPSEHAKAHKGRYAKQREYERKIGIITMNPNDLKKWMEKNSKNTLDVASAANVSPKTVERFLDGKTEPRPIVLNAFKRLIESKTEQS